MSDMKYCQFQNVVIDMQVILDRLEEGSTDLSDLSLAEQVAAEKFVRQCRQFLDLYAEEIGWARENGCVVKRNLLAR